MPTVLLFARHGETEANAKLVFQGQTGAGLDRRGRAQARRLRDRIARAGVSAIVASDLERAVETAGIVAGGVSLEVTFDPDLREVDVGVWSGKTHDELARLYPEEWAMWSRGFDVARGGGETYAQLAVRVERAALRVAAANPGQRTLVVSHGGAIKSFVAKLLGVSAEGMRSLAGIGNCSLTSVEVRDGERFVLHSWNDMAHLEGLSVSEETD